MSFTVSFVVPTEDEAKLFVEDATANEVAVVSWNDYDDDIHEWEVTDVKYEKVPE
jgi:hypothetical protein